jgi:hypothetical protein
MAISDGFNPNEKALAGLDISTPANCVPVAGGAMFGADATFLTWFTVVLA